MSILLSGAFHFCQIGAEVMGSKYPRVRGIISLEESRLTVNFSVKGHCLEVFQDF